MDARETVQKGLQARKDVRAAEARVEKLREDMANVNDARFREQLSYRKARLDWQQEREVMLGTIYRQHTALHQLREEKEALAQRERDDRHLRTLFSAVKAVIAFALLICARDMGWIVTWLTDSLLAISVTCFLFAIARLTHRTK